jgi:hypothetical protein
VIGTPLATLLRPAAAWPAATSSAPSRKWGGLKGSGAKIPYSSPAVTAVEYGAEAPLLALDDGRLVSSRDIVRAG